MKFADQELKSYPSFEMAIHGTVIGRLAGFKTESLSYVACSAEQRKLTPDPA